MGPASSPWPPTGAKTEVKLTEGDPLRDRSLHRLLLARVRAGRWKSSRPASRRAPAALLIGVAVAGGSG